jgi:hypothetical protein
MPNPYQDLPKRWPLVQTPENRGAVFTQDAQLINCYAEKNPHSGEYDVIQRPGWSAVYQSWAGTGRGGYRATIAASDYTISISGGTVYRNGTNIGSVVNLDYKMHFADLDKAAVPKLVFGSYASSYYTDYATVTHIVDADFPVTRVPGWAYLDGTLYVMDFNCNIQGSAIDDPSSWDPLNTIQARGAPGGAMFLLKHLTYVVALKQNSVEAFYNAGNATGSPLARVEGPFSAYGCWIPESVQTTEDTALWVSATNSATPQIVRMDNLKVTVVSTPAVERLLSAVTSRSVCNSFMLKVGGHRFYVFTSTHFEANFTIVLDIDQNLWYRWMGADGNCLDIVDAFLFDLGIYVIQGYTTGNAYKVDMCFTYPTDAGTPFSVDIYTPGFDAGVSLGKNLPMMTFTGDQVTGSELRVRYNDHDYAADKWSNFRRVNMGNRRPFLDKCGTFRRRALHLNKKNALPFRIKSVDLTLLLCPL